MTAENEAPDVRGKVLIEGVEYQLVRIGAVPPWMEHVPDGEGAWGYPRGLIVDGHVVYRMRAHSVSDEGTA